MLIAEYKEIMSLTKEYQISSVLAFIDFEKVFGFIYFRAIIKVITNQVNHSR